MQPHIGTVAPFLRFRRLVHQHVPTSTTQQTRALRVSTYTHDRKAYQELHQHMYEFTSDDQDVDRWQQQIRALMRTQRHRPCKLLVIVNPFGGRRRAKMLWETFAAPMMRMAGASGVGLV